MITYKLTYFDKILLKRILASLFDILFCIFLIILVWILLNLIGFFTFGIIENAEPFIFPVILIAYYSFSLGGKHGLTIGMNLLSINLLNNKNQNLDSKELLIYNFLFFLVTPVGVILLISAVFPLTNKERKCLQDYIFKTKFIMTD